MISVALLLAIGVLVHRLAPREKAEHAQLHGAGQIGVLAALALFGVDYFTSYYYATGEMLAALHPYGLERYAYLTAGVIALVNIVFGGLYRYSLGPFNEGGGSYTASMRYLWPTVSLIVAITLVEDYILTIVALAVALVRNGQATIPRPPILLQTDDSLLISATERGAGLLHARLNGQGA